jgi:hypothetical protein
MVVLVSQRQKPTSHAGEMFMETHQACDMMSFFFVFFWRGGGEIVPDFQYCNNGYNPGRYILAEIRELSVAAHLTTSCVQAHTSALVGAPKFVFCAV